MQKLNYSVQYDVVAIFALLLLSPLPLFTFQEEVGKVESGVQLDINLERSRSKENVSLCTCDNCYCGIT